MKLLKVDSENEVKHVELNDAEIDVILKALRKYVPVSDSRFNTAAQLRLGFAAAFDKDFYDDHVTF